MNAWNKMKHPVIVRRNRKIRKEFNKMCKDEYFTGNMYIREIMLFLAEKYELSYQSIRKIIYSI